MVLANRQIAPLETIMVERPLELELRQPNVQCDVCQKAQLYFLPYVFSIYYP